MSSHLPEPSEINTVDIIEKTSALTLEVFRQLNDKVDALILNQTGAFLASIGSVAAVELLKGIRGDIAEIGARLDATEGSGRTPGTTDRLTLTEDEQRLLREQLHRQEVSGVQMVNHFETFKREIRQEVRQELRMYLPLSARLLNWWAARGKE